MYHAAFELAIALLLAGIPLALWYGRHGTDGRPGPLAGAVPRVLLAVVWLVVAYGSFVEPRLLVTREYAARIGDGEHVLRVAVVSDLHLGIYKHEAWLERVVRAVNAAESDVVLLAGDHVSIAAGMERLAPLRDLRSRFGTYAVLGNWDYRVGAVDVRHAIERYAVEVLTNESELLGESVPGVGVVDAGDLTVRLIGLDDLWYGTPDWDAALADRQDGEVTILLVHEPDAVLRAEAEGIDLVIAGHTHGGQIRLPLLGPVLPLPTSLGRRFDRGLFRVGRTALFISPGAGESGPRARLFAPPEVSLLTLTF